MKIAVLADKPDSAIEDYASTSNVLVTLGDLYPADVPDVPIPHLYVYGNHDSPNLPFPERSGRHDLHLRIATLGGVTFGGFQGAIRYKPRGHFLYSNEEVAELLECFPAVDVFIAHTPCTALEVRDGVHDGFPAFDDYLQRARPRLFLCGHVHNNSEDVVGDTRVVSVYGAGLIEMELSLPG